MKILTIASPRSGGLYFTKSLADTYRLFHYHEPDFDEFDYILKRRKGVSIKIHVEQLHKHYNKPTIDELDDVNITELSRSRNPTYGSRTSCSTN